MFPGVAEFESGPLPTRISVASSSARCPLYIICVTGQCAGRPSLSLPASFCLLFRRGGISSKGSFKRGGGAHFPRFAGTVIEHLVHKVIAHSQARRHSSAPPPRYYRQRHLSVRASNFCRAGGVGLCSGERGLDLGVKMMFLKAGSDALPTPPRPLLCALPPRRRNEPDSHLPPPSKVLSAALKYFSLGGHVHQPKTRRILEISTTDHQFGGATKELFIVR